MKIVVAPDSFKESLTADQAARAIERGIRRAIANARVERVPVADGGEGTLAVLCAEGRGKIVNRRVQDPLGRPVQACYGVLKNGSAVIEMAQASGLALVPAPLRNPLKTSSFGTGQLILDALRRGCRRILLTLGGVATNDAGAGMAQALGFALLNARGQAIPAGAKGLLQLRRIDPARAHPGLAALECIALCDVNNPLCGPQGSARVFGPQKGATRGMIPVIDRALRNFARVAERHLGRRLAEVPGAGAAGGAGAGSLAFLNARFYSGIDFILDEIGFESRLRGADWVVTAEGKIDAQTAFGKTPAGVARRAQKHGLPVIAFCGALGAGFETAHGAGIDAIFPIAPGPVSALESMRNADTQLARAAEQAFRLIRLRTRHP